MIQSMESVQMEEFGTDKWYRHHGYLTKLNMQAVNSAQTQGDEFVKEYLIAHQKLPLLIESLIIVELWKEKVFPHLLNSDVEPTSSFPTYTLLYHELTLANLLETITFHADATETLGDSAVDLVDWCYRSLCHLISEYSTEQSKTELIQLKDKIAEESNLEDLRRQHRLIAFDKGMKAISLVRHLLEHSLSKNSVLPLGVGRRLLQTNDVVLALCELVDKTPWTAIAMDKETKKFSKFVWQESGIWTPDYKVTIPMGKTEGQIWISLYQALLANHSSLQYDLSAGHKRAALMRLRTHLTEDKLDMLPVLVDFRRFLDQLGFSDPSAGTTRVADVCFVEMVPEIRERTCRKYIKKWKQLCAAFRERTESDHGRKAAQRAAIEWSDAFSEQHLDKIFASCGDNVAQMNGNPYGGGERRCVVCGEPAPKRCSRCKQEWYCRRECQVKHWSKHKNACDLLQNESKEKAV